MLKKSVLLIDNSLWFQKQKEVLLIPFMALYSLFLANIIIKKCKAHATKTIPSMLTFLFLQNLKKG